VVPGNRYSKVMAMPRDIQDRVRQRRAKRLVSVGEVVGSIASNVAAAGAITGQSLRVDGGAGINTVGLYR
jgi:3-oxoacyl-[acyl-carrier protein] reductase